MVFCLFIFSAISAESLACPQCHNPLEIDWRYFSLSTQKKIVQDYVYALDSFAIAMPIVGGDAESTWAAVVVMGTGTWGTIEIRDAVIKACGLRSIADFQLLTLERRKSVVREVMLSLDARPRQLARVTGMNYETIRSIAKKLP